MALSLRVFYYWMFHCSSLYPSPAPVFGFTQPSYSEVESINGVAGVLSAQVIITNGVAVPPGTTIVVSCTPSFTGSAAFCELYECYDGVVVVAVVIRVADICCS